jgi:hypothetical protein
MESYCAVGSNIYFISVFTDNFYRVPPKEIQWETQWVLFEIVCEKSF